MSNKVSIYPNTLDAISTVLGTLFFFIGIALFAFLAGHGDDESTTMLIVTIAAFITGGTAVVSINRQISRYITHFYGVSSFRQSFRWANTNIDQGKAAFNFKNIENCAALLKIQPALVRPVIVALIVLDFTALLFGLITRM